LRLALAADLEGRLLRRWKRFFAEIETADGRKLVVHCPNPGSMLGLAEPGLRVRCSTSDSPSRSLRHGLEMVRVGRTWVGVHTGRANALVAAALAAAGVPELAGYAEMRREAPVGGGSRLDFRLSGHSRDPRPAFLEVKSVTLADAGAAPAGERLARFPDAPTERGRRHLEVLVRLRRDGARAVLLFLVQRADCRAVAPADEIDPAYGQALRAALRAGVEVLALRARVGPHALEIERPLPVLA
jgi:sugar fermentation stimulation protein A